MNNLLDSQATGGMRPAFLHQIKDKWIARVAEKKAEAAADAFLRCVCVCVSATTKTTTKN